MSKFKALRLWLFFIISLIAVFLISHNINAQMFGPNIDLLKQWLDGETIIIKERILLNKNEEIKGYNIKDIKIVHYNEELNFIGIVTPWAKKSGTAWADFSYIYNNEDTVMELYYTAVFHYYYYLGVTGKKRDLVKVFIRKK